MSVLVCLPVYIPVCLLFGISDCLPVSVFLFVTFFIFCLSVLNVCLSIYKSACQICFFVSIFAYPSVCLSSPLSICMCYCFASVCLSICPSSHLFVGMDVCPEYFHVFVSMPVCPNCIVLSVSMNIYLSVCSIICQSISLCLCVINVLCCLCHMSVSCVVCLPICVSGHVCLSICLCVHVLMCTKYIVLCRQGRWVGRWLDAG